MSQSFGPQDADNALIPITGIFDTTVINELSVSSPEFKLFLVRLQDYVNQIAFAVNSRDAGYYLQTEFLSGQVFFPNPGLSSLTSASPTDRSVYRIVINFGALPNTTTKSVVHNINITNDYTFTRIYGVATVPGTSYLPIPYISATTANIIELSVDATNVNITTGSNRSTYTVCYVVLEYIKQ